MEIIKFINYKIENCDFIVRPTIIFNYQTAIVIKIKIKYYQRLKKSIN